MGSRQPIIAIAREPINTVTSFKLISPKGEIITLLGHGNCDVALIGSRIMTLFGAGEQNINNGTISALFTTIGDQVQLNLADGWKMEIEHGYSTLSQQLNLHRPQVLAKLPAASPAASSRTNVATSSAKSALTNASRPGVTGSTEKRRLALSFALETKRPRNDENSINGTTQNPDSGTIVDGNLNQGDLDDVEIVDSMPPPPPETYLTSKKNQARVALLSDVLETFPKWSRLKDVVLVRPTHHGLWQSVNVVNAILGHDPTPLNTFPTSLSIQQKYADASRSDWDVVDTLDNLKNFMKMPFTYRAVKLDDSNRQLLPYKLYLLKVGEVVDSELASSPGYCTYFPGLRLGFFVTNDPSHGLRGAKACKDQNKNGAKIPVNYFQFSKEDTANLDVFAQRVGKRMFCLESLNYKFLGIARIRSEIDTNGRFPRPDIPGGGRVSLQSAVEEVSTDQDYDPHDNLNTKTPIDWDPSKSN